MNTKSLYRKIASEIYTHIKNADEQELTEETIELKDIKSDIINKKDEQASKKIQILAQTTPNNEFINFLNQKDNKGYTLLMLAASNNLIETVKNLVIYGADTSITLTLKGPLFKKMINYKFKHGIISEQEYKEYLQQKQYDALAIDIAEMKNYNQIVNILK